MKLTVNMGKIGRRLVIVFSHKVLLIEYRLKIKSHHQVFSLINELYI